MDGIGRLGAGLRPSGQPPNAFSCDSCEFDLWLPITTLSSSAIGLYSDDRFPGRCIVSFGTHFDAIEDMPGDSLSEFMLDVRLAAAAVRRATSSERVNIAILGNAAAHVHAHLIPRHPDREVYPDRAPWEDPRPRKKLVRTDEIWWQEKIAGALDEARRRSVRAPVESFERAHEPQLSEPERGLGDRLKLF